MNFPLNTPRRRGILLLVCFAVAAIFIYQAIRLELAAHWMRSGVRAEMERGAALEPGCGEYWDRLGRFLQFELDEQDLPTALGNYQRAVKANPRMARYWVDLGDAFENLGEIPQAREDFRRALDAYPASADIHWDYANFLLRQNQVPEALAEMRTAVARDRQLLPLAITRAWRATNDAGQLANTILPPEPYAYFNALDFFAGAHEVDAGLQVWKQLEGLHQPFNIEGLFPFLDEAIREDRGVDGKRMWVEALAAEGLPHHTPAEGSLVWNGGFEQDALDGGFDWRIVPIRSVSIEYDRSIAHEGQRSLRLDFGGGANLDLARPFQYVPVEPGRGYHFRAFLRTDAISTESGLRFVIWDPNHSNAVNFQTEDLTGTHPWTALEGEVVAGPDTRILEIQLRRLPSRLFDNKLSGTVWIDDVSLVPKATESPAGSGR